MSNKLKAALLTSLLALPLGMSASMASAQDRVLTVSMDVANAGQDSYNPLTTNKTNNVYYLVYDRLVEMGADGVIYPHLLESWDVSDDGLTIIFSLRDGVKFHDGSELNSEVLKWFLESLATGTSDYMVAAFENIEIIDNLSVEISLSRPDPNILYNFTSSFTSVPSMVAVEEYGEDFGRTVVVGTGPFMFESWKTGDETVLLRNPDYTWGSPLSDNQGPANIDKVVFREIIEESTRFLEFTTGGVDILESAPSLFLDRIAEDPSVNVVTMASNGNYHMVMNTTNELLSDVNIRRAIALSVDQDSILEAVFQGNGTPAYTYLIDRLPERQVAPEREIRFDLTTAQTIMADLGWVMGGDGVLVKDGQRLSLTLWSQSDSAERKVAVVVQAQLAELGVEIVIEQFDPSSIRAEFRTGEQDLVIRSYGWANADILEWFFNSTRQGYPNVAMWHDNESDYLMQRAMTRSRNGEERIVNFREYHEYLLSQYIWAPIVNSVNIHAISGRVQMPAPRFKILIGPSFLDVTLD